MTRRMRRYDDGEDGFAMIFTIFLIVVIAATSVAVFDLVASQSKPTAFAKKYVRTADAAAGGMQAALGQLRAAVLTATSSTASGDIVQLPCSDTSDSGGVTLHVGTPSQPVNVAGNTFSGTVVADNNPQDVETYSTSVAYFATDPTAHEADPTTAWWSANAITCKANLLNSVPSYAFLQSVGGGSAIAGLGANSGNRTEHATYQFKTTDSQVAGGRLAEFKIDGTRSMCLDAIGTNTPPDPLNPNIIPVGRQPMFEPCLAEGTAQQNWLYRNDLTIQYGGDTNQNLCLQNVSGVPRLEPCETDGTGVINPTYPYKDATQQAQEWAFNDNGQIQAPANDGTVPGGGSCIDPAGASDSTPAVANALLVIVTCSGSTTGSLAWNPDPEVGAGKAGGNTSGVPGSPTGQYVNYARFGNCLDVTGQSFGNGYLINYPCKQAPASASLTWNQIWNYAPQSATPGYGIFYTACPPSAGANCAGGSQSTVQNDCITAPTSGNIVFGTKCLDTPSDAQLWQATGKTANYSGSYLLVNKLTGTCLAPDPNPAQLGQGWPKLVVTACDGSQVPSGGATPNPLLLKWNAPAVEPSSQLANVQADQGSVTWGS
jgi:Tfp pilus assembly protein PilX